jgi:superfamily I DNA/RNA helicase
VGRIATAIISVFSAELNGLLGEYEAFKRHAAVLDFDDLLFTCREVLRRHPNVRRAAADRFRRILVDEFQDTDPVQCEIIFLLTSSGEGPEEQAEFDRGTDLADEPTRRATTLRPPAQRTGPRPKRGSLCYAKRSRRFWSMTRATARASRGSSEREDGAAASR